MKWVRKYGRDGRSLVITDLTDRDEQIDEAVLASAVPSSSPREATEKATPTAMLATLAHKAPTVSMELHWQGFRCWGQEFPCFRMAESCNAVLKAAFNTASRVNP